MDDGLKQPELQTRSLRIYGELLSRYEEWGGKLVVACFEGAAASGFAAAASLAGAASLTVDGDGERVKMHYRDGAFDFVVNTLDEALRAIKNEVRQRRPIALGLIADPLRIELEMQERGVAPDLSIDAETGGSGAYFEWLRERGWVETEISAGEVFADEARARWMKRLPAHQRSVRGGARWCWLEAGSEAAR